MTAAPSVLVFDVNETLIDIESIAPVFERIFGDPAAMREWFNQLVMYSMTVTSSGHYVDFFTLGQGVLRMLATIRARGHQPMTTRMRSSTRCSPCRPIPTSRTA